jgi:chloramphenicol-sensitive protein RarD
MSRKLDRKGLLLGLCAYLIWGGMPLYFPLLGRAGPLEIIAHRVIWSLVFCLALTLITRSFGGILATFKNARNVLLLSGATLFLIVNWSVYVYAVQSARVLEAALGYFINPLITALLGVIVLREKLRRAQWIGLGLGAVAVVVMSTDVSGAPWVALAVSLTFALYSLVKSKVGESLDALTSLIVETALGLPLALGYLIFLVSAGASTFGQYGIGFSLLLMSAGVVTGFPLLLFGAAARTLPLSTLAFLQYLGPTLQFLVGTLVLGEQMSLNRWIGAGIVWLALVVISADGARQLKRIEM